MTDKELMVDLRNQVDANLNMFDEIIRYLNVCNQALQRDCDRLRAENKRLKASAVLIHERKVIVADRKTLVFGSLQPM